MDETDYLTKEQLIFNKVSECSESLFKLAAAMDETTRTLKELLQLLKAEEKSK